MGIREWGIMRKIDKGHLENLLEWSFDEIFQARGDGDVFWVLRHYDIVEVWTFIQEFLIAKHEGHTDPAYCNRTIPARSRYEEWSVSKIKPGISGDSETFTVFSPPEQCLMITTDKMNLPPWAGSEGVIIEL
jgi:hypothetical protein